MILSLDRLVFLFCILHDELMMRVACTFPLCSVDPATAPGPVTYDDNGKWCATVIVGKWRNRPCYWDLLGYQLTSVAVLVHNWFYRCHWKSGGGKQIVNAFAPCLWISTCAVNQRFNFSHGLRLLPRQQQRWRRQRRRQRRQTPFRIQCEHGRTSLFQGDHHKLNCIISDHKEKKGNDFYKGYFEI